MTYSSPNLEDLINQYHGAVLKKDWDKDFSGLISNLQGHAQKNKLDFKNRFLKGVGVDYQHKDVSTGSLRFHAQNLLFLESLGVTDLDSVVKRFPKLFSYGVTTTLEPSVNFLKGLGIKDVGEVVLRNPAVLVHSVHGMQDTVDYLELLGVTRVAKVIQRCPKLFSMSVCDNLEPTVDYLKGLGVIDIGKVVSKHPQILQYSVENKMLGTVDFLRGLGVTRLAKVVERSPQIFSYSITDNLELTVDYLIGLGVTDVGKVVTKLPQILSYNVNENLKPKVQYLRGLGMKDMGAIISKFPQIFNLSIEDNLGPTIHYLVDHCNVEVQYLENFPSLIGYSLDKRIKPRHQYLESRGIHVGTDVNVASMLRPSDKGFMKIAKSEYSDWMRFKEQYVRSSA